MPKKTIIKESPQTEEKLCSTIKNMVEEGIGLTTTWEQNQIKWTKMRYRIKKDKNFPFVGCANIRMPTIETKLRKVKSALVNVIFGIRPVVQVVPPPAGRWETAWKIEKFLDHLIMDVIKVKPKAVISIDQALEKGFYVMKPYWKTEIITRTQNMSLDDLTVQEAMIFFNVKTPPQLIKQAIAKRFDVDISPLVAKENQASIDKIYETLLSGKKEIEVKFQDVICNYPDVALCEPERIYVPTDSGYNPQECSWIIHEFLLPIETLKMNSEYKGWDLGEVADIENYATEMQKYKTSVGSSRDKSIDTEKDLREGITILDKTGKVRIWEFYGWYDLEGNGNEQKVVITLAPDFDKVLRKISLPFYSGKYPFIKLFYELTDDRWFSHRGIPEMIEDIVKEIDIQHNQKIDQQTIRNNPLYIYRAGLINKNTVQFAWGQGLPAGGLQPLNDVIQPLNNNNPNVEFSYEREQMLLESKVEELVGQIDYTLQSMINKRQPRTLGEVQLQYQSQQTVFSLDADLCRQSFEELFNWIWDLWCQYGEDYYEFAYFGKDGFEPIKLSKEEIQGHYKVTIRGNDQNTNTQMRIQKAQMILTGMNNPVALQSGVITPMNLANAYKRMYQELDINNWEELVSVPQPPQPATPQQTAPLFKPKFKDLTDAEQAQVLAGMGIQTDVQGRSLKSAAKIQEKQQDNEMQQMEMAEKFSGMVDELGSVGGEGIGGEEQIGG